MFYSWQTMQLCKHFTDWNLVTSNDQQPSPKTVQLFTQYRASTCQVWYSHVFLFDISFHRIFSLTCSDLTISLTSNKSKRDDYDIITLSLWKLPDLSNHYWSHVILICQIWQPRVSTIITSEGLVLSQLVSIIVYCAITTVMIRNR